MHGLNLLPLLAAPAALACALPVKTSASNSSSDIIINSFQLYPENADFDKSRNVAYLR